MFTLEQMQNDISIDDSVVSTKAFAKRGEASYRRK